jgi:hypothetical protein
MHQHRVGLCVFFCIALACSAVTSFAAESAVVELGGPGGGVLAPEEPSSEVLENSEIIDAPRSGARSESSPKPEAIASGCIAPGSSVRYPVRFWPYTRYLLKVSPDRRNFDVVMIVRSRWFSRTVDQYGPGRSETATLITGSSSVVGNIVIKGYRWSSGCYTLLVAPY